jgi:hypothetical protein
MNDIQKRVLLFLGLCIPARFGLAILAKNIPIKYLHFVGYIGLLISLGFFYLYFSGRRNTGAETFGKPIWWKNFRIVHAFFYLMFAFYAIKKYANAYMFIIYDTLFGLGLFLWHHYTSGNFEKVF